MEEGTAAARVSCAPPGGAIDTKALRSQLKELADSARADLFGYGADSSSNSKDSMERCLAEFLNTRHEIDLDDDDISSLGTEDSESLLEQLKRELSLVENEKRKLDDDIMSLTREINEDSSRICGDMDTLEYLLELNSSLGNMLDRKSNYADHERDVTDACQEDNFKNLQLDCQIEKASHCLSCLEMLASMFHSHEAIGQVEDIFSEVKLIAFEGNWIRLSITTPISTVAGSLLGKNVDILVHPVVLHHELRIEIDEAMELKSIQILPNDVYLDNIISVAKSRLVTSPIEWLMRKIRERIYLCNLRCLVVKDATNSRHSFEYSDKDESVIAHFTQGIDAVIKVSQGWPILSSALQLISVKYFDIRSQSPSISFFYTVKERANLLDSQIRRHLPHFADAIEEIVSEEMCRKI